MQARRVAADERRAESNTVALLREELDKVKAEDQHEKDVAEEVLEASLLSNKDADTIAT